MSKREARKAKFRQAAQNREQEKQQEGQYEDIAYAPLIANRQSVFRFLGLPHSVREDGTDVRLLNMAMIKGDDSKWFRAVYPTDYREFILYRAYNTVCEYKWNEEEQTRDYLHSELDVFQKVRYNDMPAAKRRMATGWRPTSTYLINVINRSDMEWHRENQHSMVIAKKKTVKEDNVYYTPGIPTTVYKAIEDDVTSLKDNMDWEEYDIVIEKFKDDPYYKVFHGEKDSHRIKDDVADLIVPGDITDEEYDWERYDFDKLFPVVTYRKILNRLRGTFKDIDEEFNTRYLEELEDLAAKERKENDKASGQSRPSRTTSSKSHDEEDVEESDEEDSKDEDDEDDEATVADEKPRRRARRTAKEEPEEEPDEEDSSIDFKKLEKSLPGLKYLDDEMKAMIIDVDEDTTVKDENGNEFPKVTFAKDAETAPCPECGLESPLDFSHCLYCGVEFE